MILVNYLQDTNANNGVGLEDHNEGPPGEEMTGVGGTSEAKPCTPGCE
jgi:hypothetical protein